MNKIKFVDFKVLPSLLDYIFLLERNSSIPTTRASDTTVTFSKKRVKGRDYWYVLINSDLLAKFNLNIKKCIPKSDIPFITQYGLYMKTPFKVWSNGLAKFSGIARNPGGGEILEDDDKNIYGNYTLFSLFMHYLAMYSFPKSDNEFFARHTTNLISLKPINFIGNSYMDLFIHKIFRRSEQLTDNFDNLELLPLTRIRLLNGSIFVLYKNYDEVTKRLYDEYLYIVNPATKKILSYIKVNWTAPIDHLLMVFGFIGSENNLPTLDYLALNRYIKNVREGVEPNTIPNGYTFVWSQYCPLLVPEVEQSSITPFFYTLGESDYPSDFYSMLDKEQKIEFQYHYPLNGLNFPYNTIRSYSPYELLQKLSEVIEPVQFEIPSGFYIEEKNGFGKFPLFPVHWQYPSYWLLPRLILRTSVEDMYEKFVSDFKRRTLEVVSELMVSNTNNPFIQNNQKFLTYYFDHDLLRTTVSYSNLLQKQPLLFSVLPDEAKTTIKHQIPLQLYPQPISNKISDLGHGVIQATVHGLSPSVNSPQTPTHIGQYENMCRSFAEYYKKAEKLTPGEMGK